MFTQMSDHQNDDLLQEACAAANRGELWGDVLFWIDQKDTEGEAKARAWAWQVLAGDD